MIKNFWWPLDFSPEVTGKPKRVTALGQEFVLFRTPDGRAQVMSDLCVHRGGALSDGWLEDGCIVCPYHGWKYKPDGECVRIPANLPGVPVPRKARVDSYPTVEKYGWVWAFLGDLPEAERPPLPDLPYFGDPNLKMMYGEFHWKVHYERALENSLDIAHAPFVHGGAFGNRDEPEVEEYEIEEISPYARRATVTLKPPRRNFSGLWRRLYNQQTETQGVRTSAAFYMPCITLLDVNLPFGKMVLWNAHIPIDDYTTVTKWINLRGFFKGNWADGDARRRVYKIFNQDKPVVQAQRPEILPYDLGAELHVKSDLIQIAYRKMRQKFIDMGWGIDRHKITSEYTHHQAVVIPSPARREIPELAKAWVMKEVPTTKKSGNGSNQ
jgi:phenylpropionate dioxygenase-like ring-hydroxylating dioxygenase large terminal subunit